MNFEFYKIDRAEADKINKRSNFNLLGLDLLIKSNLRYAEAIWTVDTKYDLSIKIISETLGIHERLIYPNPYHRYSVHFLLGYLHKMLFLTKIQEYQRKYTSCNIRKHIK